MTAGTTTAAAATPAATTWDARPCLLVNRASHAARGGLAGPAAALAGEAGAQVVFIETLPAMQAAMRAVVARRQRHVIVLAGDGSVHAIVDQLAACAWRPDLLLLPGGRSNLTAADISPGAALTLLRAALQRIAAGSWDAGVVERALLRVQQPGVPARHGFFIAAAQLDAVIRRVHRHRAGGTGSLRRGGLSAPWALLKLAFGHGGGIACPNLTLDAGVLGRLDGPMRLLLATTLRHESGLFAPYARRGSGALQLTAVLRSAPFWRRLPRLLTGRHSAAMAADGSGIVSGRCDAFRVSGVGGYMLDGEPCSADPALPLSVGTGPVLRFLRP